LSEVHPAHALNALSTAFVAAGEFVNIPEISKDTAALQPNAVLQHFLQRFDSRRVKQAPLLQALERAVSCPRGNDDATLHTGVESEINGTLGPLHPSCFIEKGRPQKNEGSCRNVVVGEKPQGLLEILQRHALVESFEHSGMGRLQPHGNLQFGVQQIAKLQAMLVDKPGMALDNDGCEWVEQSGDLWKISPRYRPRIEEIAAVVKLDMSRSRKSSQCPPNLCRDRALRYAMIGGILPQIAHQTTKRTLAIGQEYRGNVFDHSPGRSFFFNQAGIRPPGRHEIFRRPLRQDPAIINRSRAGFIHRMHETPGGRPRVASGTNAGTCPVLRRHAGTGVSERPAYPIQ